MANVWPCVIGLALSLSAYTVDKSMIQGVVSSFSKSSQPWKETLKHWAHTSTSVASLSLPFVLAVSTWGVANLAIFGTCMLVSYGPPID